MSQVLFDYTKQDASGASCTAHAWAKVPAAAIVYRTNSLINQLAAAKAGIGLAVLPCYLGDREPAGDCFLTRSGGILGE